MAPRTILIQNAEQTIFLLEGIDFEVVMIGQTVEVHILPGSRITSGDVILVSMNLNALIRSVDEGGDQVRLYAMGAAVSKNFKAGIRMHAGANYQWWEQIGRLQERSVNLDSSMDYQIGLVALKIRYAYDRRKTIFISSGHRVSFYLTRRF